MPVYVIADIDGEDVIFRVVSSERGLSPLYRLEGKAGEGHMGTEGNPYLVYGDRVAEWTGKSKYDCPIVVSVVTSGSLTVHSL